MKLDYDFVNKSLHEQMMLFLNNCTINIDFSQNLLGTIIIELMSKCNNETFDLISSEDLDTQKLGSQLLFGEYLDIFNIALNLRHYDYECLHYPHLISQFRYVENPFEFHNND